MDPSSPENFELENFLPYRLSVLTNTISQGIATAYRDRFDITTTEWRILAVLGRYPGLTASEVVQRTAMDKVSISRAVNAMEQKKLLKRVTDDTDRRRQSLFLTEDKGTTMLKKIIPKALQFENTLLASLSDSDRKSFNRIITKLASSLQ